MPNYKIVIFDLDGTLADTDLVMVQTMIDFIHRYDPKRKVSLMELLQLSGPPITDTLKRYFPNHDNALLVKEFADVAKDMYPKYALAFPGIHFFLKQLKEAGIHVAIVTSKLKRNALITLKEIGLEGAFDMIVSLDEVKKPKPDPEGIFLVLNHYRLTPQDAVFIGDSIFDYQAAQNAKVDIALVQWSLKGYPSSVQPTFWVSHYEQAWKELRL
jgi:pyrophosphatase PpaX